MPVLNPPEGVVEVPLHLFGRAINGIFKGCRQVGNSHGLHVRGASFKNALLIVTMSLGAVLIAEKDLNPREPLAKPVESGRDNCFNALVELQAPVRVAVCVD